MNLKKRIEDLERKHGVDPYDNVLLFVDCKELPADGNHFLYVLPDETLEACCIRYGLDPEIEMRPPRLIRRVKFIEALGAKNPKALREIIKNVQGTRLPIVDEDPSCEPQE
jgi:hypothetical protein